MGKLIFIFALVLLSIVTSCQKIIDVKVSDSEAKLVIEAKYDAIKEEVSVNISKTISVFSSGDFPPILGAHVQIIDENGVATALEDKGEGLYLLSNYTPIYNSPYTMKVEIEGITYEATDSLKPILPLDSITAQFHEKSFFMEEGYTVFLYFNKPAKPNYNRVIQQVNGEYLTELGDQFMISSESFEEKEREVPIYWINYQIEDTVQVEFISYSKKTFSYYQQLFDVVGGTEMSSAPANPTLLWSSNSDDSKECLGLFTAFGYDTKTIIVKE